MTMRRLSARKVLALVLPGLLLIAMVGRSNAASRLTFKGLTVAPAIQSVDLLKDHPKADFDVMVSNSSSQSITLLISSLDFHSLNQTGGLAFVGSGAGQVAHKYGLASWLDLPASLTLEPGQTKSLHVVVENRPDLSPGGHYAAILLRSSANGHGGDNQVNIDQVVSVLVFARKVDGERYALSLNKPSLPTSWIRLPANIDLFFRNTGNVQTVPHGLITITSPWSSEVSRGIINTDASLVLPETTRLYRTSLFSTGQAWLPGVYRVRIAYRSDGTSRSTSYNAKLLYVNLPALALATAIAVFSWLLISRARRAPAAPSALSGKKARRIPVRHD